jgi:hypothetical protein
MGDAADARLWDVERSKRWKVTEAMRRDQGFLVSRFLTVA